MKHIIICRNCKNSLPHYLSHHYTKYYHICLACYNNYPEKRKYWKAESLKHK
jgi:threonine dehydrogenase-like Zn-dependent dehydrogenase